MNLSKQRVQHRIICITCIIERVPTTSTATWGCWGFILLFINNAFSNLCNPLWHLHLRNPESGNPTDRTYISSNLRTHFHHVYTSMDHRDSHLNSTASKSDRTLANCWCLSTSHSLTININLLSLNNFYNPRTFDNSSPYLRNRFVGIYNVPVVLYHP